MRQELQNIINRVCKDLFRVDVDSVIDRPEKRFGDYTSNIAMQLAGKLDRSPQYVANEISAEITKHKKFKKIEVISPGFINFSLLDSDLISFISDDLKIPKINVGKEILVEYGDPNAFKEMHLGHIYTAIVGDSIASLLTIGGADVKRLCYLSDIGLNIAKGIYGLGEFIGWDETKLNTIDDSVPLGSFYVAGVKAYAGDKIVEEKIKSINKSVYTKDDLFINKLYEFGKKLSFDRFNEIFTEIGVKFDKKYYESQSAEIGEQIVNENIGNVFEKSEGAIIFRGESEGLHTAVFISSQGLPTYQAKDLGLTQLKLKDYPKQNISIIITANEQIEYFKVVFAALAKINKKLAEQTIHLSHGFLTLTTGKMSSRTGKVYKGSDLIKTLKQSIETQYHDSSVKNEIFVGAIRYAFTKQKIGSDIVFSIEESIALEGNSGPYVQYAHARARSIIKKSSSRVVKVENGDLLKQERDLVVMFDMFYDAVEAAIKDYMPHYICTYLYQLAKEFNRFYEKNRVIDDSRENIRIAIVKKYADILKSGLEILHIPAPDYM